MRDKVNDESDLFSDIIDDSQAEFFVSSPKATPKPAQTQQASEVKTSTESSLFLNDPEVRVILEGVVHKPPKRMFG